MGMGMGRHRSQSAGANMLPHLHEQTHGIAFADTCPLAQVDKHSRGNNSAYPYAHNLQNGARGFPLFVLISIIASPPPHFA
jgi:hypothetical protein